MTDLRVEIAWASPEHQLLLDVALPAGSTVADALAAARNASPQLRDAVPEAVGIWGRVVSDETRLRDGDRVEVYRALLIDPREARRRYAATGRTMNSAAGGAPPRGIDRDPPAAEAETGRGRSSRGPRRVPDR